MLNINEMMEERNRFISKIKEAQDLKLMVEDDIVKQLIEDKSFDCFTVNYRRVERVYQL